MHYPSRIVHASEGYAREEARRDARCVGRAGALGAPETKRSRERGGRLLRSFPGYVRPRPRPRPRSAPVQLWILDENGDTEVKVAKRLRGTGTGYKG